MAKFDDFYNELPLNTKYGKKRLKVDLKYL
jgi:hypothetical protein